MSIILFDKQIKLLFSINRVIHERIILIYKDHKDFHHLKLYFQRALNIPIVD